MVSYIECIVCFQEQFTVRIFIKKTMFLNAQNPIFFSGGFAPRTPHKKYLLGFLTLASVLIGSADVSPWVGGLL